MKQACTVTFISWHIRSITKKNVKRINVICIDVNGYFLKRITFHCDIKHRMHSKYIFLDYHSFIFKTLALPRKIPCLFPAYIFKNVYRALSDSTAGFNFTKKHAEKIINYSETVTNLNGFLWFLSCVLIRYAKCVNKWVKRLRVAFLSLTGLEILNV